MAQETVFKAARIFDGSIWHEDAALLVQQGRVAGIVPASTVSGGQEIAGALVPGLIDLQVNGGGGVLFNNELSRQGIATICAAHAGRGTTSVLVTLITDTATNTASAIAAGKASLDVPGFLGLHLEGPHLDLARKGTHDPALIRPMAVDDVDMLIAAAADFENLVCTIAPESVTIQQVEQLANAGVTISLGHTGCSYATSSDYADAGATMVTHLYNAMGQMQHRAPNLVGAALEDGRLWAGLIADGFHVMDAALRIALRSKVGPAKIFLVSDAMSTIGSDLTEFNLNGRTIYRSGGRLTLKDGTLAGADIALIDAVRYVHKSLNIPLDDALRLASLHPAEAMALTDRGHLKQGAQADFFSLTSDITAGDTWIAGQKVAGT
jgi:N-acetylglucosamine-6-phosphate deacetylase